MSSKSPSLRPEGIEKPPASPAPPPPKPPKPPRPSLMEYVKGSRAAPEPSVSFEPQLIRRDTMDIKENMERSNEILSKILAAIEYMAYER